MIGARVDLHCHLLWGIDDGARTEEDTLEMARLLVEHGYGHVAPSPHAQPQFASNDWALCKRRLEETRALLARHEIPLRLYANAENLLDAELPFKVEREARTVGEGRTLLAEAPYLNRVAQLPEILFRLQVGGHRLLIAHPERCREFEKIERARDAVRAGAYLQLDLGSLVGRHGRTAKKLSRAFLDEGLYAVAATDIHSPKDRSWLGEAIAELHDRAGEASATRLLATNPLAILRDETLPIDR